MIWLILAIVYVVVMVAVSMLAFIMLAAREDEMPDLVTGLGLVLVAALVGLFWPLSGWLYVIAHAGKVWSAWVWTARNREVLTDPERQTP